MKVCLSIIVLVSLTPDAQLEQNPTTVDYILFFTGDVTVTPNLNEISDHKYVSKAELQEMFANPGMYPIPLLFYPFHASHPPSFFYCTRALFNC